MPGDRRGQGKEIGGVPLYTTTSRGMEGRFSSPILAQHPPQAWQARAKPPWPFASPSPSEEAASWMAPHRPGAATRLTEQEHLEQGQQPGGVFCPLPGSIHPPLGPACAQSGVLPHRGCPTKVAQFGGCFAVLARKDIAEADQQHRPAASPPGFGPSLENQGSDTRILLQGKKRFGPGDMRGGKAERGQG